MYDHHAASVYRHAARRAGVDTADDIMAETFLVAFERRNRFDDAFESALPWLLGIATVLIRRHRGSEARMAIVFSGGGAESLREPAPSSRASLLAAAAHSTQHGDSPIR
ncbi:MAG: RNA polymerase sigma factor [Salinibacterium amurskyense]